MPWYQDSTVVSHQAGRRPSESSELSRQQRVQEMWLLNVINIALGIGVWGQEQGRGRTGAWGKLLLLQVNFFFLWFKTNYPVTKVTYCFFKLSELQQGGYHEAIELSLTHVVTFCLNKCHVFAEWKPEAASPELLTATKHHSFSSFQAPFLQSLILRRNFKR